MAKSAFLAGFLQPYQTKAPDTTIRQERSVWKNQTSTLDYTYITHETPPRGRENLQHILVQCLLQGMRAIIAPLFENGNYL